MPKDDKRKELTQEEIDAQNEKFRTFFSTSVAQVPEEMKRRDEEKENTGSLLGKLQRVLPSPVRWHRCAGGLPLRRSSRCRVLHGFLPFCLP